MAGKIERDHWHPGFLGAMELEFIDYKDELFLMVSISSAKNR